MLVDRLSRALDLTDALADVLDGTELGYRISTAPSNTVGSQFWCLVGARESYAKAIADSAWSGFSCSLSRSDAGRAEAVRAALERSRRAVLDAAGHAELTYHRATFVFDLLEHEIQHHGQLIRYFYANGIAFPSAFESRYALSQPRSTVRGT